MWLGRYLIKVGSNPLALYEFVILLFSTMFGLLKGIVYGL